MSTWFVRNSVRVWCNEVAAEVSVPFYDTINQEQNPSDAVWWTIDFLGLEREGTYCADVFQESGYVTVIVIARPGIGDQAAVQAIEQIIDALSVKKNDQLTLNFVEPFFEDTFGSADQSYRVGALLPYTYSN